MTKKKTIIIGPDGKPMEVSFSYSKRKKTVKIKKKGKKNEG
jgi:hypothetical protein